MREQNGHEVEGMKLKRKNRSKVIKQAKLKVKFRTFVDMWHQTHEPNMNRAANDTCMFKINNE